MSTKKHATTSKRSAQPATRKSAQQNLLPEITSIVQASAAYEQWLSGVMPIVAEDLKTKHERMAESPFMFLRATFYRWMQHWPIACRELERMPKVLAVGDLHIENFGTWRDLDGRLVWGVNDFDETYPLSPAIDLVRLATSAAIAKKTGGLFVAPDDALSAILDGYDRGLADGASPFVLEEHHAWLRDLALGELRAPEKFWARFETLPSAKKSPALLAAQRLLTADLPKEAEVRRYSPRVAGLGSLGRPRFIALAEWGGSAVCREAKAIAPSACLWASGKADRKIYASQLIQAGTRLPDPHYNWRGGWVIRRLAPHCCKIDLSHLPKRRDDLALLESMGRETANLHLANQKALPRRLGESLRRDLRDGVKRMTELTLGDHDDWRRSLHSGSRKKADGVR